MQASEPSNGLKGSRVAALRQELNSSANQFLTNDVAAWQLNQSRTSKGSSKSTKASSVVVKQVREKTDLLKRKTEQSMASFSHRLSDIESCIERLEHASTFNFDGFQEKARDNQEATTKKLAALEVKATQLESTIRKIENQRAFEKQGQVADSNKDRDDRIAKLEKAVTDLSFQLHERVHREKVEESIIQSAKKRELETHNSLAEMRDAIFRQERLLDQMRIDQHHKLNENISTESKITLRDSSLIASHILPMRCQSDKDSIKIKISN